MTKVIHVTGDGDYSAMFFDRSDISVEEAFKAAQSNVGECQYEIEGESIYVNSYEFGDVDPKFIDFITNNFIDYGQSKSSDFFIVKEDD